MTTKILIIGAGPHGLMTLERLAARVLSASSYKSIPDLEITVIDRNDTAGGQVYRQDQSDLLLMNTVAGQITAFSGEGSVYDAKPGRGPKFTDWTAKQGIEVDEGGYASRKLYGEYMRYVQSSIIRSLEECARVIVKLGEVTKLEKVQASYRIDFSNAESELYNYVVLATGHANQKTPDWLRPLEDSSRDSELTFFSGSSLLTDPPSVPAKENVGVIGTGLTFYDVLILLTEGRGGKFTREGSALKYIPSGEEPYIYAGSRSGIPSPARGVNQKSPTYSWKPLIFTTDNVRRFSRTEKLRFNADISPWLRAEVELKYHVSSLCNSGMKEASEELIRLAKSWQPVLDPPISEIAHSLGSTDWEFSPEILSRPFGREFFSSSEAFRSSIIDYFENDIAEARRGNVSSPLKSALDVLRDTRGVLRELIDYGGLSPDSQRTEFLAQFQPWSSFLSAGPPLFRVEQMLALVKAGILNLTGPGTVFEIDPLKRFYVMNSSSVGDSEIRVQALIDARVPSPDISLDQSRLINSMIEEGNISSYKNAEGGIVFDTKGISIERNTQRVINAKGERERGLYAIGIPTENVKWFTTVGSTRPNQWSEFVVDSDNIACDIVSGLIKEGRSDKIYR